MENNNKVYIIEDDEIAASVIKKILESNKSINTIEFYTNGLHAIEKLKALNPVKEQLPSFILLDFNMPIMNGKEFLENIQNIEGINQIPVFMNSATNDFDEYLTCLNYENVKGSFSKPFSNQTLGIILESVDGN